MQSDEVEHGLERVVGATHLGFQGGPSIMPGRQRVAGGTQPVRLVVDDVEAAGALVAAHPEDQVEATYQVAPEAIGQLRPQQVVRVSRQPFPWPYVPRQQLG